MNGALAAVAGQAANRAGATGAQHGQDTELAHVTPWQKKMLAYLDDDGEEKTNPVSGAPAFAPPLLYSPELSRPTLERYAAFGLPEPSPIYIGQGGTPPPAAGAGGGALSPTTGGSEKDFGFPRLRTREEFDAAVNQFEPSPPIGGGALGVSPDGGAKVTYCRDPEGVIIELVEILSPSVSN